MDIKNQKNTVCLQYCFLVFFKYLQTIFEGIPPEENGIIKTKTEYILMRQF